MLRVDCYTVSDGLVVTAVGIDTRPEPSGGRLSPATATHTIRSEEIEQYGAERAICQALSEALEAFPGVLELAML